MNVDWNDSAIDPLDLLAEEFIDRYRRGERPGLDEYEANHPEMAERIRHLFPALVELETISLEPPPPRFQPPASGRIGEYRILREVGAGGMGIVYEAVQESLGRRVALKVLPHLGMTVSPERFLREARIAARLHHTNIVPVFSVGSADGIYYYAMQFIDGPSLGQVFQAIRSTKSPKDERELWSSYGSTAIDHSAFDPVATESSKDTLRDARGRKPDRKPRNRQAFRELAQMAAKVANALAYAHKQGVLHRDIKPSNLLVDSQGTPWLGDFGLAKSADDGDLTASGDLLGTLRYMAPERFRGPADGRSDVYSLGATLYEMITLRPAFHSDDRLTLVESIGRGRYPLPRSIDRGIPRDLETICLKAMAREPDERYASALELADDLKMFLADQPIRARRASLAERVVRWWRRDRAVASLTLAVGCLLIALATGSAMFAVKTEQARIIAVRHGDQDRLAERQRSRELVRSLADRARAGRTSRRPGQRFDSLEAIREAVPLARSLGEPTNCYDDLRTQAIASMALPDIRYGQPADWGIRLESTYRFDPELRLFASANQDGKVRLARVEDGGTVVVLDGHPGEQAIRLGAGGLVVGARSTAGGLRVWDLRGPSPVQIIDMTAGVTSFDVRSDGEEFAIGLADRSVSIRNVRGPAIPRSWGLDRVPDHLAYSPDNLALAVADAESVAVFDLATSARLTSFARKYPTFSMAWHPRGGSWPQRTTGARLRSGTSGGASKFSHATVGAAGPESITRLTVR